MEILNALQVTLEVKIINTGGSTMSVSIFAFVFVIISTIPVRSASFYRGFRPPLSLPHCLQDGMSSHNNLISRVKSAINRVSIENCRARKKDDPNCLYFCGHVRQKSAGDRAVAAATICRLMTTSAANDDCPLS